MCKLGEPQDCLGGPHSRSAHPRLACFFFEMMPFHSEAGNQAVIGAGGVAAVVRAMEAHGGEADVQEMACAAMP